LSRLVRRLPEPQAILQVYAVIAVLFAGWTITAFIWKLSAWLLFLNLGEIFTVFSYAMAADLVESLILLLLLLILCVVLPAHSLRDKFAVRGTILSIGSIGAMMAYVGLQMMLDIETGFAPVVGAIVMLVLTALVLGLTSRSHFAQRIESVTVGISDRLVVFLFLLFPLFLMLTIYVVIRNFS
jgi:hypothetical protein